MTQMERDQKALKDYDNEVYEQDVKDELEKKRMDYHKEYFTTMLEMDKRILELTNEDCRVEKEIIDSDNHNYCIGVYVPVEEYILPLSF